jgi:phage N-6-adenine-methyltransferase
MNIGMNVATPKSDEWETPDWLFRALDAEFGLDYDAAASESNNKCPNWTADICAANLRLDEYFPNWRVFCNPPYSNIQLFVNVLLARPGFSIMLLPVRTDSDWFHQLKESQRVQLRFFRKRIAFCLDSKPAGSPRFASMIAVIR